MASVNFLTLLGCIERCGVHIFELGRDIECNFSENPIGVGSTMNVYEAYLIKDDKKIKLAAKVTYQQVLLHTPDYKIYEILDSFRQEIRIMQHLSGHPNIISFYGMSFNELKPIVFVELSIGSLQHYLEDMKDEGRPVDLATKAAFSCDVADGLHALHAVGVVHGDIKADNVLLFPITEGEGQHLIAKIADFGKSATTASIDKGCGTRGTRNFHAPENTPGAPREMQQFKDKPKKDNYSYGLFVWQVIKDGEIPYANFEDRDIEKIKHEDKDLNILLKQLPSNTPQEFLFVISKTTRYQPTDRITLSSARRILTKLLDGNAAMLRKIQKEAKETFINNAIEIPKFSKPEISSIKSMRIPLTIKRKIYSDFEKAARKKVAEGALSLSICYKEGFGVNIDFGKGVEWLIKAAEYGSLEAMIKLANEFDVTELPVDPEIVFLWFIKAANAGSLIAQFKVSICYYIGVGVEKDISKGDFWISKCGSAGLVSTFKATGLYENDKGLLLDSALSFLLTVCDEIDSAIGFKPGLLNEDTRDRQINKMKDMMARLGADVFTLEKERPMSIHKATLNGYLGMVKYLSSIQCVDVDTKDNKGYTPLHKAALTGHIDIAILLVKLGADVNSKDNEGSTSLHKAVSNGHITMAKLLVTELGADVNAKDNEGSTPLHKAILNWDIEMAKLLVVELGADVDIMGDEKLVMLPTYKSALKWSIDMIKVSMIELEKNVRIEDFFCLVEYLKQCTNLDLEGNGIDFQDVCFLANGLKLNIALTNLNLKDNHISYWGTYALSESLEYNTTLTNLCLSNNHIGDLGVNNLAGALKMNATLTSLNLSYNCIGYKGVCALSETLKQNTVLTNLNLSWNNIGDDSARALAQALKQNTILANLNLERNYIGNEGAYALAEGLKQNLVLINLNLEHNKIGIEGAHALAEILGKGTALTNLNLCRNNTRGNDAHTLSQNPALSDLYLKKNQVHHENARAPSGKAARDADKNVKKKIRSAIHKISCEIM